MHHRQKRLCTRSASFTFFEGFFWGVKITSKSLILQHCKRSELPLFSNSAVCLHFPYECQLFFYTMVPLSAVCLHYGTVVSCLFTFILRLLTVCLHYATNVSCLFTLWYHCQLFIYTYPMNVSCLFSFMVPMSAVCLHRHSLLRSQFLKMRKIW